MNKLVLTFSFFSVFFNLFSSEILDFNSKEIILDENSIYINLDEIIDSESETRKKLNKITNNANEKISNIKNNEGPFLKKLKNLINGKFFKVAKIAFSGGIPIYLFFFKNKPKNNENNNLDFLKEKKPQNDLISNLNQPKLILNPMFESNFFDEKLNNNQLTNGEKERNFFIDKILTGKKITNNFYDLDEEITNTILKVLSNKNSEYIKNLILNEPNLEKIYFYDKNYNENKLIIYFCEKGSKFEIANEDGKTFFRPISPKRIINIGIDILNKK